MDKILNIKIQEFDSEIKSFKLVERLGGDLAIGEAVILVRKSNQSTDIKDLHIQLLYSSGELIQIIAYVYEFNILNELINLKFICCNSEFTRNPIVRSYDSVLTAINSNWSNELIYSGSDIQCKIHQRSETGYQLVSKLIKGLDYGSVYGFRSNSIIVNNLSRAPEYDVNDIAYAIKLTNLNFCKSKVHELEPIESNLSIFNTVTYSKCMKQVEESYSELIKNYYKNEAFIRSNGNYSISVSYSKFEPKLEIGNIVNYRIKNLSVSRFIVFEKHTEWSLDSGINFQINLIGYDR